MKPSEILSNAKKWCQYQCTDTDGRVCIGMAIGLCHGDKTPEVIERLQSHLGIDYPIWHWNDAPERTFSEVREALLAIGQ